MHQARRGCPVPAGHCHNSSLYFSLIHLMHRVPGNLDLNLSVCLLFFVLLVGCCAFRVVCGSYVPTREAGAKVPRPTIRPGEPQSHRGCALGTAETAARWGGVGGFRPRLCSFEGPPAPPLDSCRPPICRPGRATHQGWYTPRHGAL